MVEVPGNSLTADARDILIERTREYSAILKPYDEHVHGDFVPRIIYLGTPQSTDSIYNKLATTFVKRIWPVLVPTEDERVGYGDDLAPMVADLYDAGNPGGFVCPRFGEAEIADRRAEYGAAGFQLQFMLNTNLSDEERFPLKVKNLIVTPVPPEKAPSEAYWLPNPDRKIKDLVNLAMKGDDFYSAAGFSNTFQKYQQKIMVIDPSGRGADETGYAILYFLNGYIWCPEAGGLPGGYDDDTLEDLCTIAQRNGVTNMVIEGNFGDGMYLKLMTPVLHRMYPKCGIEEVKSVGMKEQRICDVLEPVISQHKLIVDPSVIENDSESAAKYEGEMRVAKTLIHQMTRICREKGALRKDDRLDALAIGVGYFVEAMSMDAKKQVDRINEQERMEYLQKHMGLARKQLNGGRRRNTYNSRIL